MAELIRMPEKGLFSMPAHIAGAAWSEVAPNSAETG
jgi:hypothetical protein